MIAKGRNTIEAEIDFMYEAFKSLIDRVELSYKKDIQKIRDIIQQIDENTTLAHEEKASLLAPYFDFLDTIILQNTQSQIALFCGIYSYWEKSLNSLCKHYKIEFYKRNGSKNYAPKLNDYLNGLLNKQQISHIPKILLSELDELRNYFIHGTLSPQRKSIIKGISKLNYISIQEGNGDFSLSSFIELHKTLNIIYSTLKEIINFKQNIRDD